MVSLSCLPWSFILNGYLPDINMFCPRFRRLLFLNYTLPLAWFSLVSSHLLPPYCATRAHTHTHTHTHKHTQLYPSNNHSTLVHYKSISQGDIELLEKRDGFVFALLWHRVASSEWMEEIINDSFISFKIQWFFCLFLVFVLVFGFGFGFFGFFCLFVFGLCHFPRHMEVPRLGV